MNRADNDLLREVEAWQRANQPDKLTEAIAAVISIVGIVVACFLVMHIVP